MSRISSKTIKRFLWIIGTIFSVSFILLSVAFAKRESLMKFALNKMLKKAKDDYDLNIVIKSAHLSGMKTLHLRHISVVPNHRDSLYRADELAIKIKILPLLWGRIEIQQLDMRQALLNLTNINGVKNFDFLFKKKKKSNVQSTIDWSKLVGKLMDNLIDKIPGEMNVKNFQIRVIDDTLEVALFTQFATIENGILQSTFWVNKNPIPWHLNGLVEPSDYHLKFSLFADKGKVELPYIKQKLQLQLNFDTLSTELKKAERSSGEFKMYGHWSVTNLGINHAKIASTSLVFPNIAIQSNVFVGTNYFSLDSSSIITLGKAKFSPFIKYTITPHKKYELKLQIPTTTAQTLFDAIPTGMFQSLDGMKVEGDVGYSLDFLLDSNRPDDVKLDIHTYKNNFKIKQYGAVDIEKIKYDFTYLPYEKGNLVRPIQIGADNPNYVSFNEISPHLRNAILTSEDYSFFTHKGFNEEAIRKAIATNFKAHSYKRGGSTISMQLVKNIFLNRQKTLFRKIEEIMLVWLIENNRLVSKQRMYEVYLNMIEWGPNVYGIGEAARFYFGKHPMQLNLGESIYLAHIVPKPKAALYAFLSDGSLKPYLKGYYNLIGGLMVRRRMIMPDSTNYGFYQVRLKESLRRTIAATTDTLQVENGLQELNPESLDFLEQ